MRGGEKIEKDSGRRTNRNIELGGKGGSGKQGRAENRSI